ncbi:MAG: hypothetical protein AAGA50_05975 [Pseudomonadota bacterium]
MDWVDEQTLSRIPVVGFHSAAVATLRHVPFDTADLLNASASQPREYRANRFDAWLMSVHMDERKGGTFSNWMMRSHPPTELRHDELKNVAN